MKIDLHIHTKKVKKGDAKTRNISVKDFIEKTKNVDIMAITNHNQFDKSQFEEIKKNLDINKLLWCGVELDITCNDQNTHLILVCDISKIDDFTMLIDNMVDDVDDFSIDVKDLMKEVEKNFKKEEVIFFVHYMKSPKISENTFKYIRDLIQQKGYLIFAEPTNYATTSIMINHDIRALNGSDVADWNDYDDNELLKLKIPVKDFKTFYLLSRKDNSVIEEFMKTIAIDKYNIELGQKNKDKISITLKNEINIIFGGKGTGKSEILKALKKQMEVKGKKVGIYESSINEKNYDELLRSNCQELKVIIDNKEGLIKECLDYKESFPKDLLKEIEAHVTDEKNSNKFPIIHSMFSKTKQLSSLNNNFQNTDKLLEGINIVKNNDMYEHLDSEEKNQLSEMLNKLFLLNINDETNQLKGYYVEALTELHITKIKAVISAKKGLKSKPTNYHFSTLIASRENFLRNMVEIDKELKKENIVKEFDLGELPNKGIIKQKIEYKVLKSNKELKKDGYENITKAKCILNALNEMKIIDFSRVHEKLEEINNKFNENDIKEVNLEVLLGTDFNTYINEMEYVPSKGEKAILLINKSLENHSNDIYLFDEIEQGFENNYITDMIIPKINMLVKQNKTVVIVTHNANIATHLYPFNNIYREYKDNKYFTYIGNMFKGTLKNIDDNEDNVDWLEKNLMTLEGSKEAFLIRGEIYGI
ncbi:MAG: hypothetical protein ACK5HR_01455 [Mycoplasmatales bacterium]